MMIPNIMLFMNRRMRRLGTIVGCFIGLAFLCNAFAAYFVTQERYVYYWGYSAWWDKYRETSESLLDRPLTTLISILCSIRHDDYNPFPVFALIPFEWLFGPNRLSYILSVVDIYMLPGAIIISITIQRALRHSLPKDSSLLFLMLATTSILMLHPLWIPVLRGYPDVGGIVLVGAVLLIHFEKPLAEQRFASLVATGLILCLLVLLRRWYLFWVVAFFPALFIAHSLAIYQRYGIAWRHYTATGCNALIIGIVFALSLFGFATPLALRALHTDYSDIYSAYQNSNSLLEAAGWLPFYFGWAVIVEGVSGLIWLAIRRETRVLGIFLIIQSVIAYVLFVRTQDLSEKHYYLLFPAISLGIATIIISLSAQVTNRLWRGASVGLLMVFLLGGFGSVFAPSAASLSSFLGDVMPKVRIYPLVRNDIEVLNRLLDRLDELETQQRGEIYVLASSEILNSSILQIHCRYALRPRTFCYRILTTNDVDKRDGFPHQFLSASYLIVANPTQYHLRVSDQRVVGILARDVAGGNGIGASFRRLPGEFKLDAGVTAWMYEKLRPFERTDLIALQTEFAKYYPDKRHLFNTVD